MNDRTKNRYKMWLIFAAALLPLVLQAQGQSFAEKPPINWQLMDLNADGLFGISMEKTHKELLKSKKVKPVVVAVIDGGMDLDHEDLKQSIWINFREIAGNGIDDDKNGYIDDVHGWNFMGSAKGSFQYENMEVIRALRKAQLKDFKSSESIDLRREVRRRRYPLLQELKASNQKLALINGILSKISKQNPTDAGLRNYKYRNFSEEKLLVELVGILKTDRGLDKYLSGLQVRNKRIREQLDYLLNLDYNPRSGNLQFPLGYYGNGDVKGLDPIHGTHVSGIIAADRGNNTGIKGVADQVRIMTLRAIPNGETLDEDLAGAIRYAADNGAKVINMSTGKFTSVNRALIDEAVKYAMLKDVLIVHAAGNNSMRQDTSMVYPQKKYIDGTEAAAWIEVGASGYKNDENVLAWFSNYGKNIDVFAPGVEIYSTIPNQKYSYENGTSMAAPVVSGLAGMLRAYYPKLSALQVKEIIMKSVTSVTHPVKVYQTGEQLAFTEVCKSGGIVNAYKAFKLAKTY